MAREIGSEVRRVVDVGNPRKTIEELAEIARGDLATLGDDYTGVITDHKDGTISIHCEKKYWLREKKSAETTDKDGAVYDAGGVALVQMGHIAAVVQAPWLKRLRCDHRRGS